MPLKSDKLGVMEEQRPDYLQQIPPEDWEKTLFQCQKTGRGDGAKH